MVIQRQGTATLATKVNNSRRQSKLISRALAYSKIKVATWIIVVITLLMMIYTLNQQHTALLALKASSQLEDYIVVTEQHLNHYQSAKSASALNQIQKDISSTYSMIEAYFSQDIDPNFVPKELSFQNFEIKLANLNRDSAHGIAQDTLLLLFTLKQLPKEQVISLLDSGFTLTPMINAMQAEEKSLIAKISNRRQQLVLILFFSSLALALLQLFTWLFYKSHSHKRVTKLTRSHLRVAMVENDATQQKEFLQLISHEFRAPISAIISALELIPNMKAQQERLIQQAEQSSYRLLNLTNNLTELLTDNVEDDLVFQQLDLISLLDECISPFSVALKDKKVDFNMHCSHSVPHYIESDPTAISKVITNVLENAVKFTANGLIDVTITTQVKNRGIFLVVIISDTGIGIDEKAQTKIFDKFYRGNHSSSKKFAGAGIGLSVAKHSLDKLGGTVTVASTLNVGSEFKILFPIKPVETPPAKAVHVSNAKFAIVDDLEISRLHLHAMITTQGYSARTFSSGAELLNLHDDVLQFTAIIADLYMPGMTGLELVKTLHAIYGERIPPIIVLSATPDIANIIANTELSIFQSFVKPIDKYRFVDTLHQLATQKLKAIVDIKKANILVVEDEPINAEMVQYMLSCMGHSVTVCYTGEEAIVQTNENEFDCMLLDINLPDINGLEVAKIVKERHPLLPIIALTANARRNDKEASLQAGIRYHLVKPVTFQELKNTLKLAL